MDEINKNIDESWKEAVKKEKEKEAVGQDNFLPSEPDFNLFITTLALQASISLGTVPNPATNKKEENLTQAKFIIDTLEMLQQKTKGNLTSEETKLLENLLYELRMQYVSKVNKEKIAEDKSGG
ncbi:MAG: DUF1844 domain-containing protein [Candidatus Omnitrophica bacterium]|nr:DUF1844 domain-containing protein [Candidatus Omnitrophota bacterium]MBU4345816.1 DUF1844 domain-containing protein [Candidatus Omnitrophota bacterium]MBU4473425.1 DUF1844 domain-containing protein [Candidatus Omnitrophota bacterium]MCG2706240.1 DUF1844 domain-containing protein [Candidatus Omnitrophota bacterium]